MIKARDFTFLSFLFCFLFVQMAHSENKTNLFALNNSYFGTASMESLDPPVILSPIGEQEKRSAQFYNFIWQARHTVAAVVEYELRIYEKRKGLSDLQIVNATPPVFRKRTLATSYLYSPADPELKMNREYLFVVQVKDVKGSIYFKNNGRSEMVSFSIVPACIPGNVCDDGFDCTYDDQIALDCSCKGTPYYDPDADGDCDLLILPAPTIVVPEQEAICNNLSDLTVVWDKQHSYDLAVNYELKIWQSGLAVEQTKAYEQYDQLLMNERNAFGSNLDQEQLAFQQQQKKDRQALDQRMKDLRTDCDRKQQKQIAEHKRKKESNTQELESTLQAALNKCADDRQEARALLEKTLDKERKELEGTLAKELNRLETEHQQRLDNYDTQAKAERQTFNSIQEAEKVTFFNELDIRQQESCGEQESFVQSFEEQKKELKTKRRQCLAEAEDFKLSLIHISEPTRPY